MKCSQLSKLRSLSTGMINQHTLPYNNHLPSDPTLEEVKNVVCTGIRPDLGFLGNEVGRDFLRLSLNLAWPFIAISFFLRTAKPVVVIHDPLTGGLAPGPCRPTHRFIHEQASLLHAEMRNAHHMSVPAILTTCCPLAHGLTVSPIWHSSIQSLNVTMLHLTMHSSFCTYCPPLLHSSRRQLSFGTLTKPMT